MIQVFHTRVYIYNVTCSFLALNIFFWYVYVNNIFSTVFVIYIGLQRPVELLKLEFNKRKNVTKFKRVIIDLNYK
jgi:hypothetical protein